MLLMGLINLLDKGGFFEWMINALSKYTKDDRSSELVIALIDIILCLLTVANSVVIVMEGPIAKKLLVETHNISPDRSANILDAVSCVHVPDSIQFCSPAYLHVRQWFRRASQLLS